MLLSAWCGVSVVEGSYFGMTGGFTAGGVVNPLITGATTGIFWNGGDPYQFYLEGGCPVIGHFDVIEPTNMGVEALMYPDCTSGIYAAGIQSSQTNSTGNTARTMWHGFSFMNIRDIDGADWSLVRIDILTVILEWLNGMPFPYCPTGDEMPGAYRLAQNYPNPFNPVSYTHLTLPTTPYV